MLKNFWERPALSAASVLGGIVALIADWLVLVRVDHVGAPLDWILPWSYGLALGTGTTFVYVIGGGRGLRCAVDASMLASAFAAFALVSLILLGAASETPLHGVLLIAPVVLLWAMASLRSTSSFPPLPVRYSSSPQRGWFAP